jgi:hypothetical protein
MKKVRTLNTAFFPSVKEVANGRSRGVRFYFFLCGSRVMDIDEAMREFVCFSWSTIDDC